MIIKIEENGVFYFLDMNYLFLDLFDAGHMGQRPRSLLSSMATAGPVQ